MDPHASQSALRYLHPRTAHDPHPTRAPDSSDHRPPRPAPQESSSSLPDADWFPDPARVRDYRYWNGAAWTSWISSNGETETDSLTNVRELPTPTPEDASIASRARDQLVQLTGGEDKSVGDRVLHTLGALTLSNWANGRMADAFFVPQLIESVQNAPKDPICRLHLGLRLQEQAVANDRIRRTRAYISPEQIITRPLMNAVTKGIKGDTTPAHVKVLQPLLHGLVRLVGEQPKNPDALNALARIYWYSGYCDKAIEVLEVSKKADLHRGETYYIGAEVLLDMRYDDLAMQWARYAWEQGCYLSAAILGPRGLERRFAYRTPKLSRLAGYHAGKYVTAWSRYYENVPADQLEAFIGPSPITAGTGGAHVR